MAVFQEWMVECLHQALTSPMTLNFFMIKFKNSNTSEMVDPIDIELDRILDRPGALLLTWLNFNPSTDK